MIVAVLCSLGFIALGVVAYTGVWKGWIRVRTGYGSTIGFAWLWLGAAFLSGSIGVLVAPVSRPVFTGFVVVAAALFLVAVVGFFWLPRFLLPAWFRAWRGDQLSTQERRRLFHDGATEVRAADGSR